MYVKSLNGLGAIDKNHQPWCQEIDIDKQVIQKVIWNNSPQLKDQNQPVINN